MDCAYWVYRIQIAWILRSWCEPYSVFKLTLRVFVVGRVYKRLRLLSLSFYRVSFRVYLHWLLRGYGGTWEHFVNLDVVAWKLVGSRDVAHLRDVSWIVDPHFMDRLSHFVHSFARRVGWYPSIWWFTLTLAQPKSTCCWHYDLAPSMDGLTCSVGL